MGAWGDGIFENDTTNDWLGSQIDEWLSFARKIARGKSDYEGDVENPVPAMMRCLRILAENEPAVTTKLEKKTLRKLKKRYLKWFDEIAEEADEEESGFYAAFRQETVKDFDRLIELAVVEDFSTEFRSEPPSEPEE